MASMSFSTDDPDTELGPAESSEYADLVRQLRIDPENLEQEFLDAPEIFARFVERHAHAEELHLKSKFIYEQTKARLTISWRERLHLRAQLRFNRERASEDARYLADKAAAAAAGLPAPKRVEVRLRSPLAGDIDAAVLVDPEYAEARLDYITAECEAKRLKGFCDASRVKRDMLTNVGMRHNAQLRVSPMEVANSRHPAPTRVGPGRTAFDDY